MTKNKPLIMIATIVGVLLVGGVFLFSFSSNKANEPAPDTELYRPDPVEQPATTEMVPSSEVKGASTSLLGELNPVENATLYEVAEGTEVSYTAQKRFLQKEDAVVIAKTDKVQGAGWLSPDNNNAALVVKFDLNDLESDSPKRDEDIMAFFDSTQVNITGQIDALNVVYGEEFEGQIPLNLRINNVEKEVMFDVSGVPTQESLTMNGTSKIKMSDFGVNPPSLVGVYTVDDEIEIGFKLNAISK